MATITGSNGNDTLTGTPGDDVIQGFDGDDLISGEGGDDLIYGGSGNDTIFGDAGAGGAEGANASAITLSHGNLVSSTIGCDNNAVVGDYAIYRDVAMLEDGTSVWGRLVLTSVSDTRLSVDLAGDPGSEILLNAGVGASADRAGDTASFRLEFFDPTTGEPVALNSTATFNDLDRNKPGDQESVTLDAGSFTNYITSADTSLNVTQTGDTIIAAGTEANDPSDQDAWLSAGFEHREYIEFTLETRSSESGFGIGGTLTDDPIVTPFEGGNDTIEGGPGDDLIFGQGGDDLLLGGGGNDTLYGGPGNDTLISGPGADYLSGGTGSDLFQIVTPGDHVVVGGEDDDDSDIDVLDLSGLSKKITHTGPESGYVEFLDSNGVVTHTLNFSEIERVICFTPGTRIATPMGTVPVESLRAGDRVITRDNGIRQISWIGQKRLDPAALAVAPALAPVLIRRGALGADMPDRDMMVSPQHRMLVSHELAEVMFGEREVLVAARHLTGLDGVDVAMPLDGITYLHVMFENHEVILADGAWSESFQPGDYSLRGVESAQRDELLALFPELANVAGLASYQAARMSLKAHEARLLVAAGI